MLDIVALQRLQTESVRARWDDLCDVRLAPEKPASKEISFPSVVLSRLSEGRQWRERRVVRLPTSARYLAAAERMLRGTASDADVTAVGVAERRPAAFSLGLAAAGLRACLDTCLRRPSGDLCAVAFAAGRRVRLVSAVSLVPLASLPAPRFLAGACLLLPAAPPAVVNALLDLLHDGTVTDQQQLAAAAQLCSQLGGRQLAELLAPGGRWPEDERCGQAVQPATGGCSVRRLERTGLPPTAAALLADGVGTSISLMAADGATMHAHKLALCLYSPVIRRTFETLAANRAEPQECRVKDEPVQVEVEVRRGKATRKRELRFTAAPDNTVEEQSEASKLCSPDCLIVPSMGAAGCGAMLDYIYHGHTTAHSVAEFLQQMDDWIDFHQLPIDVAASGSPVKREGAEEETADRRPCGRPTANVARRGRPGRPRTGRPAARSPDVRAEHAAQHAGESAVQPAGEPAVHPAAQSPADTGSADSAHCLPEPVVRSESEDDPTEPAAAAQSTHFTCHRCGKSLRSAVTLANHVRTHTGERPFPCSVCDKRFNSKSGLRHHVQTHSGPQRDSVCDICGKRFTRHNLWSHIKTHTKPYWCGACSVGFSSQLHLKHHVVSKHDRASSEHVCSECGRAFTQKAHLNNHMKLHSDKRKLFCTLCRRTYPTVDHLANHTALKHAAAGRVRCNDCGKMFTSLSSLSYHRRSHTGYKPFQCTFCERRFARPDGLQIHVRRHTGEKPYTCPHCPKQTVSKAALNKHLLVHAAQKTVPQAPLEAGQEEEQEQVREPECEPVQEQGDEAAVVVLPAVGDGTGQHGSEADQVHIQTAAGVLSVQLPACLLEATDTADNAAGTFTVDLQAGQYITYM